MKGLFEAQVRLAYYVFRPSVAPTPQEVAGWVGQLAGDGSNAGTLMQALLDSIEPTQYHAKLSALFNVVAGQVADRKALTDAFGG